MPANYLSSSQSAHSLQWQLGHGWNQGWWRWSNRDTRVTRPNLVSFTGVIFVVWLFAAEAAAMQIVSEWAASNHNGQSLTICTNSQSPLKAIDCRSPATHHLGSLLNARPSPTTLLWVPDHEGTAGNELTNAEAKAAVTSTADPPRPNPAEVYGGFSWSKDCKPVLLACL